MCVISSIGDNWNERFPFRYPNYPEVTRAEFEQLKEEMEELKKLLKQAKIFDEKTGQPECETEDKIALLKEVAKHVGVDLEELFKEGDRA